ncbi:hypothetical protein [Sphingomonas endophytica]|uniref:TonB C-terminal domain-containing protein n=1 Tax=Sphingomonas endophytica TaxID=869719 RepID=A0A147I9B2_9SPHN|nr:hypothetical protein [Sphingomonas endophytica]KTT75921.1 hypothetical protein NS334_01890 [Sphingomonas endophytica]
MFVSLLALVAAGQAAAPAPSGAAPTTQQRFDAASTAVAEGRCADAVTAFDALEAGGATKRSPLLAATVAVRRGRCLVGGPRDAQGRADIARGLPVLAAKGADFAGDVYEAHMALGRAAQRAFDYDAAIRDYRAAADGVTGTARIPALLRLAQVTMFDHDGTALATIDEALRLAGTDAEIGKRNLAAIQTVKARVLLNDGREREAYTILKDSLAKQGGLTMTVGASDIATRSDLAIAALKNGDRNSARNYLAYTGAGRMRDTPFTTSASMAPPVCGEGGLAPEDQAIVEFSLEADGHVSGVAPIYATGNRAKALAFARAVTGWSWRAEDAAKVPPLFRYATRIELRCVAASAAPPITGPLWEATAAWLAEKGAGTPAWEDMSAALALPLQRAALADATARGDRAKAMQAALALVGSPVVDAGQKPALLTTINAALDALAAPVTARTYVATLDGDDLDRNPGDERQRLRQVLARPAVAADALSAATLRLLIAQPRHRKGPPDDAAALLTAVVDDPALPANHRLKIAALLSQANVLAARGDLAGARAMFDRTGLTSEQCATIGLQPAVKRSGAGAQDYPMEAVQLGFEGWVLSAYDIAADGRTVAPRAVIAYPPFIFDEAANGIIRDARYTSTFRPDGALACSGQQMGVRFLLPNG